ncbi:hypothetical protein LZ31DRAFT_550458 [Colletotrichum somersetense]|nr:hypothetical protein LZ31DRAFT_550458 [Colletotrichum somersetense]
MSGPLLPREVALVHHPVFTSWTQLRVVVSQGLGKKQADQATRGYVGQTNQQKRGEMGKKKKEKKEPEQWR